MTIRLESRLIHALMNELEVRRMSEPDITLRGLIEEKIRQGVLNG